MANRKRTFEIVAAAAAAGVMLWGGGALGQAVAPTPAPSVAPADEVDDEAVAALKRMSAYLATLNKFEIRAETTRDLVTMNGNRVQIGGTTDYKVRRPNGFAIDVTTDYMQRQFYYDGKQFAIYAPKLGYYAKTDAPPTIGETLGVLEKRYDIELPLVDLFRWNDPNSKEADELSAGFLVGPALIDGAPTQHYAFREKDRDWEIWIQDGPNPLPRKLVIIDRSDEARPAYSATLTWNLTPSFPDQVFTYAPSPDAKAIHLATLQQ